METILLLLVVSTLNAVCFLIGARTGQKVSKGENITVPIKSPVEAIREHQDRKEADMRQNRYDVILHNVETYDGTGRGQEDVPRGVI